MIDYSLLKKTAAKSGLSPHEILALAPQNDPFYVGAPRQVEKAKWFEKIYSLMGNPPNCHIRRVHYWLVTTQAIPKPNGKPYENTQNDWGLLALSAKYARYLGLVPIEAIIDRRNPEPTVNCQFWNHRKPSEVRDSIDEESIIESIVDQFYCYNPSLTQRYMIELWCFTPETEVQTISGPKPISSIQIGDLVLTHKGRYRPVINTMKREYSGDLVSIRSRYSCNNVRMTPNHKLLTALGQTKGILGQNMKNPEWVPAEHITNEKRGAHYVGDYVAFPRLTEFIEEIPNILPDNSQMGRSNGSGAQPKHINTLGIDSEVAWMLGYFVGNGFARDKGLVFTINKSDQKSVDRLILIGRRFGIGPKQSTYVNTVKVCYNSVRFCKWFKDQFGGESLGRSHTGSWNKRVPAWIVQGPENVYVPFLDGLWDSDGTEHGEGHKSICTCSRNVAYSLRIMLSRLGEFSSITKTKQNHLVIRWGGAFTWGKLQEDYMWFPLKEVIKEQYSGLVYNIEVGEDNSYVTEFVVHNCEKSTMNDVLLPICHRYGANLITGLGELSITSVYLLAKRIVQANKPVRIFYISDFDPAGESMPIAVGRKIEYFARNYADLVDKDIKLIPLMLTSDQCAKYNLPRTPIKDTEKRKERFEDKHGQGATELDAMEALHPGKMEEIIVEAIEPFFDVEAWNEAVRKNREIREKVRGYLVGNDFCSNCDGLGWFGDPEERDSEQRMCEVCQGEGTIKGRIGSGIMNDLDTSNLDSYSPPQSSQNGHSNNHWLYSSDLEYIDQLERYREFKRGNQDRTGVEEVGEEEGNFDLFGEEE